MATAYEIGLKPSDFYSLQFWEFQACINGYGKRNELEDYRLSRQALWLGNFKKGTNMKKLLGYEPFKKHTKKTKVKDIKQHNNNILGKPLSTKEIILKVKGI